MKTILFELVTPQSTTYKDTVDEVTLPAQEGQITILPGHIPLITALKAGEIILRKNKEETYFATSGGYAEATGRGVRVLADSAQEAEEIDELKAIEAKKRAEERLKDARESVEFANASALLEKSLAQLKVAQRKRKGRSTKI